MLKTLIVDDSKYQRYIIELCLAAYCACDQAGDGEEAVLLFERALQEEAPYDLVILDILMPVMDGHAALQGINALHEQFQIPEERRCKVIMLSSLDDPQNMMRAQLEEGAHAYVTKPFEDETLIEALRNLDLLENPLENGEDDPIGEVGGNET
jgi:two-component system, chemotaxis family, chemotaxis protein CheY